MKKLIGLVVIVAALVLGTYYAMGVVTERTLKKNLEMVNQSNGLYVDVENYQRGWFTSTAQLNWRLHVPSHTINGQDGKPVIVSAKDYNLLMPLVIHHGPIIFADSNVMFGLGYASTDLLYPAEYVAQFDNLYTADSTKPNLNLSVFVNYLNNSELRFNVPGFKLISKQGKSQFEWLGMTSAVSVSSKMDQINGNVAIDGIRFMKDEMKAVMSKMSSDYELHRTDSGLYLGDANVLIPSVLVMKEDKKILEVDTFTLHSKSDVKQNLFSSSFKAGIEKLFAQDKNYGASSLAIALKNLDATVLADINQQVNKIHQGPDSDRQRAFLSLLPDVLKLVNKGAEFEVSDLSVTLPEGTIQANLLLALPSENITNPFQLLQKITGEGKFDISATVLKNLLQESLKNKIQSALLLQQSLAADAAATTTSSATVPAARVELVTTPPTPAPVSVTDVDQQASQQADEKIATMVKNGVLTVQGTQYIFEVKLNQGQLVVNGKPFNPAMMQF